MAYQAKNYTHLIGMDGFSKQMLENHFTLYQGYVTNTNKLADILSQMLKDGKTATPEYACDPGRSCHPEWACAHREKLDRGGTG
ncbi:MAG: hypothetical protein ACLP05_12510, partial [Candidatus Kryptoniota bacterium]